MKSKPGENFLSLQCKDRVPYPLPPSIFTDGFSPVACYDRHGQETFHLNEGKPTLYTHTLKWCGKIVLHIQEAMQVFLCHLLGTVNRISLRIAIFTDENPQTPSPLYLYIVKIENFHPVLTPSLKLSCIKIVMFFPKPGISLTCKEVQGPFQV